MMEPVFPFAITPPQAGEGIADALHGQLREAIIGARLPAGHRMPSTRQAASALGVARNTVTTVWDRLIAEGYLLGRPGARAEVAAVRRRHEGAIAARTVLPSRWRQVPPAHSMPGVPPRSFRTGMPDPLHFPHARWRQLVQQAQRAWSRQPFAYPPTEGVPELRAAIAKHVAFARAVACSAEDVIVTHGATQAFDLLARVFVQPGRTRVAVEWPGYPPLAQSFAGAGAAIVPVPVDDEGLQADALPEDAGIACVTPSHQSPLGAALSMPRRLELLDWASRADAIVVEDDYDGEFRYGARPLDALQTLDRHGRVFYVGTFSKSLFPSLRVGFLIAPAWARDALIAAKRLSDPYCDDRAQAALAAFIDRGELARHVRRMQRIYAARREALLDAMEGPLSRWLRPLPSEAGLHLAAVLRDPQQQARVQAAAQRHLPGATSIAEYAHAADAMPGLLFGFGCIDREEIATRLQALRRALAR